MIHVTHAMCGMRDQQYQAGKVSAECCYCVPHDNCGIAKEAEWMEKHEKKISDEYKQEKAMLKKIHFPEQEKE